MNRRHLLFLFCIAAIALGATALLRTPIGAADESLTSLALRLRGDRAPDSAVVLVYVDESAIRSLGWPVRRNFQALLVRALTDLHAAAIGMEVLFEDRRVEYPEYDELLGSLTASSGRVVAGAYVDTVGRETPPARGDTIPLPLFPALRTPPLHGSGLHLPFPALRAGAAGIGHLNINAPSGVPAAITTGQGVLPAFAIEILRVYLGAAREAVDNDDGAVSLRGPGRTVRIPLTDDGEMRLDVPGNVSVYRAYPLLEVLRSYDALRADRPTSVPLLSFRGKIVLVGVIAEGRSSFVPTPANPRLPSLAFHAAVIDNALRGAFAREVPSWLVVLITLAAGMTCGGVIIGRDRRPYRILAIAIPPALVVAWLVLAIVWGIRFPVLPPVIVCLAVAGAAAALRHRRMRATVVSLVDEKQVVEQQLHDREARVAALERELLSLSAPRESDRTGELLEEIRRYRAEIRELSSRADDLEPYREEPADTPAEVGEFEGIVHDRRGKMRAVVEFVVKIAGSDAPVLILGESGTGKELVARAIHRRSRRSTGPFVAVNCGALAENLLESELFGHERGAFTGAVKDKPGRFELAHGGTIFLDEIGEVSEGFQLKLLRVLQEGELERVGGTRTLRVDVRVVAATNKDLREEVRQRHFREDLYYRLNVLAIGLPPLRERTGDIPLLVRHFMLREGAGGLRLSRNVVDALRTYSWPGNVRELESAVRRAVLMTRAEKRDMISARDLGEEIASAVRSAAAIEEQVLELVREKKFLRSAISETADDLGGLNRGTVAEYLRGEFLRVFADNGFDAAKAVPLLSFSADPAVNDRVRRRLAEYLANIAEGIDRSQPWESARSALRPKTKNLPQKYHGALERCAEAYYRGLWSEGSSAVGKP